MLPYLALLLSAGLVVIDQLLKLWVLRDLQPIGTYPIIQDIFPFTYVENRGAAFSILQGKRWFFIVITVVMVGILIWLIAKKQVLGRWGITAILFIIGGAIGNFIDRLHLGYVIDMFDFRLINFAVFNVADCFIVVGGIMCVIYFLFMDEKLQKAEKEKAEKATQDEQNND